MAASLADEAALCHPISGKNLQRHCERSEAIHGHHNPERKLDCFVASLLAMTKGTTS
jgi:hypothetical protein